MELTGEEPAVTRQLDGLDQLFMAGGAAADGQASLFQALDVVVVDFVAMAVALGDLGVAVHARGQRAGNQIALLAAQAHGAAHIGVLVAFFDLAVVVHPLVDQRHHREVGVEVELGGVGAGHAGHVARVFNQRDLHAQADAEVGDVVLAGKLYRLDLAFHAALAEASRHQDGVHVAQRFGAVALDLFRVDVDDVDLGASVDAGVLQRFGQRLVRLGQIDVLAHHRDLDRVVRLLDRVDDVVPGGQVGLGQVQLQLFGDDVVDALGVQHARHLVDGVGIVAADHRVLFDVAEQRDLALFVFRQLAVHPAQQDVRLNADLAQLLHRVLGRFGLDLAGGGDVGHVGQVHVQRVLAAVVGAHLADGFQEGQRFDIAHGAADLDDGDVGVSRAFAHLQLDFVGDVRDHLDCAAQVVAAAFLGNDRFVHLAGGEVVALLHLGVDEAFVVAEVEVGFRAVFGDEHFAVLEGAHGARVDIDVGVELQHGDFQPAGFEDRGDGRSGNALAQGGHHATGYEDVLGHEITALWESGILP